jgi:hypothetical protein
MGNHLIGEKIGDNLLIDKKILVRNRTDKKQRWVINGQEVDCEANGYAFIRSRKDGRIGIRDRHHLWWSRFTRRMECALK